MVIQAPSDASYSILLGIDFLTRFTQFSSDHSTIKLLTPCGHWISAPIIRHPTVRHTISFWPRSQDGGSTYIPKENTWKTRSHASKTLMHSFEVRLENEVKALLHANFDDKVVTPIYPKKTPEKLGHTHQEPWCIHSKLDLKTKSKPCCTLILTITLWNIWIRTSLCRYPVKRC